MKRSASYFFTILQAQKARLSLAKLVLDPTKHDPVLVRQNRCLVKFDPIVKPNGK
uniref:Uncharacterized protein n=1 Tax=Candidatus Kentrum sp. LFY TaxID=2126342 RepID=A0A450WTD6_9GAMM|nr:MAG: hypothetical protein BECKLFY1418C_GA0070996_107018 [Candidatus Kentron sp. LFY]